MFADQRPVETKPRRRRSRWLLVGVPFLVLALGGLVWLYRAGGGLTAAVAEADRLDPRWRLEEIAADRFTPADGENSADLIPVVRAKITGRVKQSLYDLFTDLPAERQLNEPQRSALAEYLGPLGPALAEARSLIDKPRGRHPIVYSPDWISTNLNAVQTTREVVALLKFDGLDRAEAGDADGAIRAAHASINAGSSISDEPNLIAQLVRIACHAIAVNLLERAVAQGEPSEAALAALQARLLAVESEPLLLYALRGERAGGQQFLQSLRDGTAGPAAGNSMGAYGLAGGVTVPMSVVLRVPGYVTMQQAGHLLYMNEMVELAKRPPAEWTGPLAGMKARLREQPYLVQQLVPAVDKVAQACRRNHAILRCAIVLVAAERYRHRTGRWPATPDDLVKAGLLKAVPTDPFAAGQSIKFARTPDGLIVYTTGPDGTDDGGKLDRDATKVGADYGLRLWDVSARRQPPLPPKADGGQ